ncbi:hypothetical protein [Clostridium sp.]|uniref:hypothetical protein n=1 Tax=Clostridium sp. TaxID=1506 RepID=UPI001D598A54|nr:hypothetical protein [Clostridium sp.]MBS5938970.1 hypothetical protein [Clostridium sp.]
MKPVMLLVLDLRTAGLVIILVPFPLDKITGGVEMKNLKELNKYAVENGFCCVGCMSKAIKEYKDKRYLESCLYDFTFSANIKGIMLDVAIGSCDTIITVVTEELTEAFSSGNDKKLFGIWDRHYEILTELFNNSIWSDAFEFVESNYDRTYITLDTDLAFKVIGINR